MIQLNFGTWEIILTLMVIEFTEFYIINKKSMLFLVWDFEYEKF